ncbi:metal-dependent hydrolase [Clostridium aminobutyricum]|uniref:Metal-dependent hydrolase n=1 Tax=Clostridium aminobutyricum TaxID=33953 RepID=A0A939IIR5_CLOAM|nr:metal-dependent hydrolase [Clostridium aminobutyricum]MBN7772784.1 metal-dependent hydrolase [Clostridium aminobutyricum]
MNYITHSLGGAAAGVMVINAMGVNEPTQQSAILTGAVLGSLFIDIDHKKSWIAHKIPLLANAASGLFKHRGVIHTPVFVAIVSIILGVLDWSWLHEWNVFAPYFIRGFIPGMMSHLVLDTLNVQGIMWLWPISNKRFHLLRIRTNSMMEMAVCVVLGACLYGKYGSFF